MIKRVTTFGLLLGLAACGGGGGGSGAGGTTTNTGLIQSSKMSCSGATCFGGGALSLLGAEDDLSIFSVTDAITLYNSFNQQMIPALNGVIEKIENGVKAGGATSCTDISTNFTGDVTVSGTTYNARTNTSALTGPGTFSTTTMNKKLSARVNGGGNFVQADFSCGAETDASPLVGRVLADDGTKQLSAWYERGSANHIRILMVAKSAGVVYAAWFKTDDGDNYEIILATNGTVYQGAGNRSAGKINFKDNGAGAAACLNSTTGAAETCSYTLPTVTNIPGTLLNSGADLPWASVANNIVLLAPVY